MKSDSPLNFSPLLLVSSLSDSLVLWAALFALVHELCCLEEVYGDEDVLAWAAQIVDKQRLSTIWEHDVAPNGVVEGLGGHGY